MTLIFMSSQGQGVLSEKLRSFSMQDLTLIRDEDTVHMRSHEPQLHPSGGSLLETIEDSGTERPCRALV